MTTGYRPTITQQLVLRQQLTVMGFKDPIVHHVLIDTPLLCRVQIEYKKISEIHADNTDSTTETKLRYVHVPAFTRVDIR